MTAAPDLLTRSVPRPPPAPWPTPTPPVRLLPSTRCVPGLSDRVRAASSRPGPEDPTTLRRSTAGPGSTADAPDLDADGLDLEADGPDLDVDGLDLEADGLDPTGTARAAAVLVAEAAAEAALVARRGSLPDPRSLAGQLAQAVVEVVTGDRPLTQLLTRLSEDVYDQLSALAPPAPTTPTLGRDRLTVLHPRDRPKVRTVHVCQPAAGVAEVAARVQTDGRSRALALRLEEWRGRWRCSALVFG